MEGCYFLLISQTTCIFFMSLYFIIKIAQVELFSLVVISILSRNSILNLPLYRINTLNSWILGKRKVNGNWQTGKANVTTSSNQRLGVRSVVPVKISVCRFIIRERLKFRYDKRLKFRYEILAKSTIVLWIIWFLCFMVSKRRLTGCRWTAIWWPLVTRCVTVRDSQV